MELNKKYSTVWDYIEQSMPTGPLRDDLLRLKKEIAQLEAIVGYAVVLESMLRQRNIRIPPRPSGLGKLR